MKEVGSRKVQEKKLKTKKTTGGEMHKAIVEQKEKRSIQRVHEDARKMVKRGKMKRIDSYFKRIDSESD